MSRSAQAAQAYARHARPTPQHAASETHRQLVEQYGRLVRTVARRIWRRLPPHARGFEEDDLVSVGIIGLLDAHDRYEERDGIAFESFAEFRIKGAILDEIRRHDFFPRRLRAKANKLRRAEAQIEAREKRSATDDEVAEVMEMTTEEVRKLRGEVAPYSFVDTDDECITLRSPFPNPDRLLLEKELRQRLVKALDALGERHKLVLDLYYNQELKLKEIAEVLEVSEGRVSQLKSEAVRNVRDLLENLD